MRGFKIIIDSIWIISSRKLCKKSDSNEIDSRLTAGWYVDSGQRKRYLKSLNQKKK